MAVRQINNSENALSIRNKINNGLEINSQFNLASISANADYSLNLDTYYEVANQSKISIEFPSAIDTGDNARISLNNGTDYNNIKSEEGVQLLGSDVEGKFLTLTYDGTDWIRVGAPATDAGFVARGGGLLINGNFELDQRQGSPYSLTSGYTLDRFTINASGSVTVSQELNVDNDFNSKYKMRMVLTNIDTNLQQLIENPNNVLYNQKSTISFWVKGSLATTCNVRLRNNTLGVNLQTIQYNITTSWTKVKITFDPSTQWSADDVIRLYIANGFGAIGTFEFAQVKFELGSLATEYIPKTYAEELNDCRRYAGEVGIPLTPFISDTNQGVLTIPVDQPIRELPTLTATTDIYLHDPAGNAILAFSNGDTIPYSVAQDFQCNVLSVIINITGLVSGTIYQPNISSTGANKVSQMCLVFYDAEL
jgi:hypothetical protein